MLIQNFDNPTTLFDCVGLDYVVSEILKDMTEGKTPFTEMKTQYPVDSKTRY